MRVARRGLSSAAGGTLYDTLGIERNQHDAAQLKAAFRQRARLVHPDVQQAGADAAAFVRLVHAYETLSCPKRRALYDATLSDGSPLGGRGWRAGASAAAAAGDPHAEEQRDEEVGKGRAGAVVRNPRREFNDALARAYHGPAVDLGAAAAGVLPLFFEGDERTELLHEDLMQLCSGRTLLGVVRHIVLKAVEAGGGEPQLLAVDVESPATVTARLDELRLLSHTGKLVASARRRPRAPHDSARPGSPWLHIDGGAGEGNIEVWLHDGDAAQLHCCVSAAGGGFGYGAIKDAAGTTICSVFLHSTPFVTHLHFYAMNGAMQLPCKLANAGLGKPPPNRAHFALQGSCVAAQ